MGKTLRGLWVSCLNPLSLSLNYSIAHFDGNTMARDFIYYSSVLLYLLTIFWQSYFLEPFLPVANSPNRGLAYIRPSPTILWLLL